MDLFYVIGRTIISIIILFIMAKLMGKKQVAQMNLFDYIVGITIGSVVADISLDIDKDYLSGIISLIIYSLSGIIISYLTNKSITLRRIINGVPTILIEKGKIIEEGLSKSMIDINDLLSEARISGYFDIEQINYAIMETSGKISFMPKEKEKPVTLKDMKIKVKDSGLTTNVLIDGNILYNNLQSINKDEKWLFHELSIKGYHNIKNILLVTVDDNDKVNIYSKNNNSKEYTKLE